MLKVRIKQHPHHKKSRANTATSRGRRQQRPFHSTRPQSLRQIRRTGINNNLVLPGNPLNSNDTPTTPQNPPITLQFSPSHFFEHINQYDSQYKSIINRTTHHLEDMASIIASRINQHSKTPKDNFNILLYGDLGSGKTFFSRQFIRVLADSPALPVPSPTFNIELTYRHNHRVIKHIDLYRLKHSEEAHIIFDHLPIGSYNQTNDNNEQKHESSEKQLITLIEWPHILHNSKYMPMQYIRIDLEDLDRDDLKEVTISFCGKMFQTSGLSKQIMNDLDHLHQQEYPEERGTTLKM